MVNYLNLSVTDLTSELFLDATPTQRATWLCMMRYCAQQETGGLIAGAATWGNRKWMQVCAVTKEEVNEECQLWEWDGENIRVLLYPIAQEGAAKARREAGKSFGRGHPKQEDSSPNSPPKDKDKDKDKDKGNGKDNTPQPPKGGAMRFDEFWKIYPVKKSKKPARDKWVRKKLDSMADQIIADVQKRQQEDRQWREGYIPHPSTYLSREGWQDDIDRGGQQPGNRNEAEEIPYDQRDYSLRRPGDNF